MQDRSLTGMLQKWSLKFFQSKTRKIMKFLPPSSVTGHLFLLLLMAYLSPILYFCISLYFAHGIYALAKTTPFISVCVPWVLGFLLPLLVCGNFHMSYVIDMFCLLLAILWNLLVSKNNNFWQWILNSLLCQSMYACHTVCSTTEESVMYMLSYTHAESISPLLFGSSGV